MPTIKKGQKQYQIVLEEGSEVQQTLLEWAKKRGLSPGRAARCILADWSDAINGKANPFAIATAASTNTNGFAGIPITPTRESESSPEKKARQQALLDAAEQFM